MHRQCRKACLKGATCRIGRSERLRFTALVVLSSTATAGVSGVAAARISTLLFAEFERLFEDKDRARRFADPRNAASQWRQNDGVRDRSPRCDDCAARSIDPPGGDN